MLFHYQQNRSKYICRQPENADQFTRVFFIGRGPNETSRPLLQDRPENGSKRCDLPLNDQGPSNEYYKADSVEIHRNPHTVDSTKPNFIKVNGLIDEQDARRSETRNLNKTFNGQDIGDIGDYYKSGNRSDQVLPENYSNRASLSKTFAMGERHSVGNQKKSYQKGKKQAKSNHHGKGPLHRKAFDAQLNSFQQNNSDRQWNTGHVQQRSRNVSDCASGGFSRANMSLCEQPSSSGSSSQIGSCYDNHHHRGRGDHRYQPQNEYQLYQDREMANKTLNQTQCQFYENKTFHQGLCQNQTIAGRWIRHGEYQHVVNQRARQGQRQNQGTASGSFHWNQHQQLTNQSFHQRQHQDAHHKFDPSGNEGVGEKTFLHDAAINSRIEELERQPVLYKNRRDNCGSGPITVQKARAPSSRLSVDLNASLPTRLIETTEKAKKENFNKTVAGRNEVSEKADLPKFRNQKSRLFPSPTKPTPTEDSKSRLRLI